MQFTLSSLSTSTSNNYYTASTSSATTLIMTNNKVRRASNKMRHNSVNLELAHRKHFLSMREAHNINDFTREGELCLYFVVNDYAEKRITLYTFVVLKETEHFYTICINKRINKKLNGSSYALTPEIALEKAIRRAHNYLDILIRRGVGVSEFIKALDHKRKPGFRELRDFESAAKSMDVDALLDNWKPFEPFNPF